MHRAAVLPRVRAVPRIPRAVVWTLAVAALLIAGSLWFRDSSLVAVRQVTVTGIDGPQAPQIRQQLADAARDMTTLHVRRGQLLAVTRPYPIVKGLEIHTHFPHRLVVDVVENTPVAYVQAGGATVPVGGDGRILRGAAQATLPIVPVTVAPGGERVVDREALKAIAALAAAPAPLRARVTRATSSHRTGILMELRNGPQLRFGAPDRLDAKWAAVTAVLADPSSEGAAYLDVRYPERPAAGGLEDPTTQRDPEAVDAATPTTSTVPSGAATTAPTATTP